MSAIAGKAINSTLGTADFKGLDEVISDNFSKLVEALTPKIQTVSVSLSSGGNKQTTVSISEVDISKSKIEVTSIYQVVTGDQFAASAIGFYVSPTFSSSTKININYNSTTNTYVTLTITTYGG